MSNNAGNGPVDTLRDRSIKASIWRNETEKDGRKRVFFTTSYSRTYEDDDGNLRDSHSFSGAQNLQVARLAQKAYDRELELIAAEKESTTSSEE